MKHMGDAIKAWRPMPVLGQKVAAQDSYVVRQVPVEIRPAEAANRAPNSFFGGIVVIGPHQTNYFSVKRGLEEIGKKSAAEKTGHAGQENCRSAPRASTQKTINQVGTPCAYILALPCGFRACLSR